MNWKELNTEEELGALDEASFEAPQIIFKHSPMCPISRMVYYRLKDMTNEAGYVDVLASRPVSDFIAGKYGVKHESPQVLIIKDGKAIHDESHGKITARLVGGWLDGKQGA